MPGIVAVTNRAKLQRNAGAHPYQYTEKDETEDQGEEPLYRCDERPLNWGLQMFQQEEKMSPKFNLWHSYDIGKRTREPKRATSAIP